MPRTLPTLIVMACLAGLGLGLGVPAFSADRNPAYQLGERLPQAKAAAPATGFREIKWDDLVPADWDPRQLFKGIDLRMLDDSDPRAMRALEKLREAWSNAPARADLNGNHVRIPGFVVPLERKGAILRRLYSYAAATVQPDCSCLRVQTNEGHRDDGCGLGERRA